MLALHALADAPSPGAALLLGVALAGAGAGLRVLRHLRRPHGRLRCRCSSPCRGACGDRALLDRDRHRRRRLDPPRRCPFFLPLPRAAREDGFGSVAGRCAPVFGDWQSYLASPSHAHQLVLALRDIWVGAWDEVLFPAFSRSCSARSGSAPSRSRQQRRALRTRDDRETLLLYGSSACWRSGHRSDRGAGLYTLLYRAVPAVHVPARAVPLRTLVVFVLALFAALARRAHASLRGAQRRPSGHCVLAVLASSS